MDLIQIFSWFATATGVCFAAYYYITTLKNAEREKRKQTILQKLPAYSKEFSESYYSLYFLKFKTRQEFFEKYGNNQEIYSNIAYMMNVYNTLGILYSEKLMSIEDIMQLYPPNAVVGVFERFEFIITQTRLNSLGKDLNPGFMVPFEQLYHELKKRYPGIESWPKTDEELAERRRLREINIFSKIQTQWVSFLFNWIVGFILSLS